MPGVTRTDFARVKGAWPEGAEPPYRSSPPWTGPTGRASAEASTTPPSRRSWENRALGDTTTLADPAVVDEIARRGREEAAKEEAKEEASS